MQVKTASIMRVYLPKVLVSLTLSYAQAPPHFTDYEVGEIGLYEQCIGGSINVLSGAIHGAHHHIIKKLAKNHTVDHIIPFVTSYSILKILTQKIYTVPSDDWMIVGINWRECIIASFQSESFKYLVHKASSKNQLEPHFEFLVEYSIDQNHIKNLDTLLSVKKIPLLIKLTCIEQQMNEIADYYSSVEMFKFLHKKYITICSKNKAQLITALRIRYKNNTIRVNTNLLTVLQIDWITLALNSNIAEILEYIINNTAIDHQNLYIKLISNMCPIKYWKIHLMHYHHKIDNIWVKQNEDNIQPSSWRDDILQLFDIV